MNDNFWDGFEKQAILGPAVDIGSLGIPSMIGYQIGKGHGMHTDQSVLDEAEPGIAGKVGGGLFVPGYLGYRLGLKAGRKAQEKAKKESRA